jgi:hypothetical protein
LTTYATLWEIGAMLCDVILSVYEAGNVLCDDGVVRLPCLFDVLGGVVWCDVVRYGVV